MILFIVTVNDLFIVTVCNSLLIVTRLNYGNDYKGMKKASPFCGMEREEDDNREDDENSKEDDDGDKRKVVEEEGNKDDDDEEEHEKGEVLGLVIGKDALHIVH